MSSKQRRLVGQMNQAKNLDEFNRLKSKVDESFEGGKHPAWVRFAYSGLGNPPSLEFIRKELDNLNTIGDESPFIEQVLELRKLLERVEVAASALEELPKPRRLLAYREEVSGLYKNYAEQVDNFVRQDREFGLKVLPVLDETLTPEGTVEFVNKCRGNLDLTPEQIEQRRNEVRAYLAEF